MDSHGGGVRGLHATLISWRQQVRLLPAVPRAFARWAAPFYGWVPDLIERIRHICAWLPVLWKDRDFDQAYLVEIVQFKLSRMADHFEEHQFVGGWERQVRDIRVTVQRLERYRDSHKHGPPMPFPEHGWDWEDAPDRPGYRQLKKKPPHAAAAQLRWSRQHSAIERENWDAAWEMIRKRGRTWWD